MPGRMAPDIALTDVADASRRVSLSDPAFYFLATVAAVQGGHVFEHIVQVLQVFVFGVREDEALGLLGYVLQFNGTEEWLHLGYNTLYLLALYALILPLIGIAGRPAPMGLAVPR
jgi:hypothetical protein